MTTKTARENRYKGSVERLKRDLRVVHTHSRMLAEEMLEDVGLEARFGRHARCLARELALHVKALEELQAMLDHHHSKEYE